MFHIAVQTAVLDLGIWLAFNLLLLCGFLILQLCDLRLSAVFIQRNGLLVESNPPKTVQPNANSIGERWMNGNVLSLCRLSVLSCLIFAIANQSFRVASRIWVFFIFFSWALEGACPCIAINFRISSSSSQAFASACQSLACFWVESSISLNNWSNMLICTEGGSSICFALDKCCWTSQAIDPKNNHTCIYEEYENIIWSNKY